MPTSRPEFQLVIGNDGRENWHFSPSEEVLAKNPYLIYFAGAMLQIHFMRWSPILILKDTAQEGFNKVAFMEPLQGNENEEQIVGPGIFLESNTGDEDGLDPEVFPVYSGNAEFWRVLTIKV